MQPDATQQAAGYVLRHINESTNYNYTNSAVLPIVRRDAPTTKLFSRVRVEGRVQRRIERERLADSGVTGPVQTRPVGAAVVVIEVGANPGRVGRVSTDGNRDRGC